MGTVANAPYTLEYDVMCVRYQPSDRRATSKPVATNSPPAIAWRQATGACGT